MSLSINSAKLFKSGKFMMTAAATIAVVASATATTLTSVNADDSAAPAKVTTSQKVEPSENHTYKGHVFDAPIRVETHDLWTANSESVIADNTSKQGIKSVDQLGDYKVVWGDTLSTMVRIRQPHNLPLTHQLKLKSLSQMHQPVLLHLATHLRHLLKLKHRLQRRQRLMHLLHLLRLKAQLLKHLQLTTSLNRKHQQIPQFLRTLLMDQRLSQSTPHQLVHSVVHTAH